ALGAEAYRLDIGDEVRLTAATPAGMGHAAHTLAQLAAANPVPGGTAPPRLRIEDAPAFGWRGMHLDVSRHFFDAAFVRKYIDLLALHKLNVLHWHLTDDQGWRIEIRAYPRLTRVGATRTGTVVGHTHDAGAKSDGVPHSGFYSQAQVREIVAYAESRGVTIVPEIDIPGHASAILAAYPELGCGPRTEVKTHFGIFKQVLCPHEETFAFLDTVFGELAELFPGRYVHIGGDEVVTDHWEHCESCRALMAHESIDSVHGLQDYFVARAAELVRRHGREPIGWDEILNDAGDAPATILAWRGVERGLLAARHGHDVIMTPVSHTYFDFYQSTSLDEPMSIHGLTRLETAYAFEPVPEGLAPELRRHVLGGQGALWTEYVASAASAERQVLPRMSALAEALWSPPAARDFPGFVRRLETFVPFLEARGYTVSAAHRKPEIEVSKRGDGGYRVHIDAAVGAIHYTLDGSLPDERAPAYRLPFDLPGSAVIRARTRSADGRWFGDSRLTVVRHAGLGAALSGTGLEADQAGRAASVLLDGRLASDRIFHYEDWFSVEGRDLDLVLEWPAPVTVRGLSVGIDAGLHRRLVRPAGATVSVDGGDGRWRTVAEIAADAIAAGGPRLDFAFEPAAVRRLRLVLANPGPAWSEEREAEAPVTLRIDELVVH
ncbi:MAG TPA: family 20 glycosylhydrolase, partial [Woeseiaceae bacterium]|nr:family 20 glycosylhydrolase [Woeseiaceae bacterium]